MIDLQLNSPIQAFLLRRSRMHITHNPDNNMIISHTYNICWKMESRMVARNAKANKQETILSQHSPVAVAWDMEA